MSRNTNITQLKESKQTYGQEHLSRKLTEKLLYLETTLMITNKMFQPLHFLLQVHKHTTYNDLVAGEDRLRKGVDQRAEALKSLVHQNFDRFISAKNTIDHVYEEMKSKQLNQQQEYGTIGIETALDGKRHTKNHWMGILIFILFYLYTSC